MMTNENATIDRLQRENEELGGRLADALAASQQVKLYDPTTGKTQIAQRSGDVYIIVH
jgi:hypothetical protein